MTSPHPASTASPATRVLGVVCLAGMAVLVFLAFVASPKDAVQASAGWM